MVFPDIDKMVDQIALKHNSHWLIVTHDVNEPKQGLFGEPLPHSNHWDWVKHYDDVDLDNGMAKGWGKSDKVIGGTQIRYIYNRH